MSDAKRSGYVIKTITIKSNSGSITTMQFAISNDKKVYTNIIGDANIFGNINSNVEVYMTFITNTKLIDITGWTRCNVLYENDSNISN
jgi:hypothetical protein